MKVKELKEALAQFDDDYDVAIITKEYDEEITEIAECEDSCVGLFTYKEEVF